MKVIELHDSFLDSSVFKGTELILFFDTLVSFPLNDSGKADLKFTSYFPGKIILSNCNYQSNISESEIFDGYAVVDTQKIRLIEVDKLYTGNIKLILLTESGTFEIEGTSLIVELDLS